MGDENLVSEIRELVGKLNELAGANVAQLRQSTELNSLLRGKLNDIVWSGMIQLEGESGNWKYQFPFTIDYAAVGFIDSLDAGPYTITSDAMGGTNGPGTFLTGDTLSAVVPMIGKQLFISSTADTDTPPQLFVAIFTTNQPLIAQ